MTTTKHTSRGKIVLTALLVSAVILMQTSIFVQAAPLAQAAQTQLTEAQKEYAEALKKVGEKPKA